MTITPSSLLVRRCLRTLAVVARVLVAILAAVLLAAVGLLWALSQGFERDWVRRLVERSLSAALDAPVELADLKGPLYPRVSLVGLSVTRPDGSTLRTERIDLRLQFSLRGRALGVGIERADVHGLELRAPSLHSMVLSGAGPSPVGAGELHGDLGVPQQAPPASGPSVPLLSWIELRELEVHGGRVSVPPGHGKTGFDLRVDLALERWLLQGEGVHLPRSGHIRVQVEGGLVSGQAIVDGRLIAELQDLDLRVSQLDLATEGGTIRARGEARLTPSADLRGAHFDADLDALDLAAWTGSTGLRSMLAGHARVRVGRADEDGLAQLETELDASLSGRASGFGIDQIELAVRLARDQLVIDQASLRGETAELSARGTLGDPAGLELQGHIGDLGRLDLPAVGWLASLRDRRLAGQLELAGRLQGGLAKPRLMAELRGSGLGIGARRLGRLRAGVRVGPTGVEIERFELRRGPQRIEASGAVRAEGLEELQIRLSQVELGLFPADLLGAPELAGRVSGAVRVDGSFGRPQLDAKLSGTDLRAGDLRVDRAALELDLRDSEIRGKLEVTGGGAMSAALVASYPEGGLAELDALVTRPDTSLEIRIQKLDLSKLAALLPLPPGLKEGRLGLLVNARGTRAGLASEGRLDLEDGRLELASWREPIPVARASARFSTTLEPSGLTPDVLRLEGNAELELGESVKLSFRGQGSDLLTDAPIVEVEEIQLEAPQNQHLVVRGRTEGARLKGVRVDASGFEPRVLGLDVLSSWGVGGRIDAQLVLDGLLPRPSMTGAAVWEKPRLLDTQLDRAVLEISSGPRRSRAVGRLEALGAVVAWLQIDVPTPGQSSGPAANTAPYATPSAGSGAASWIAAALANPETRIQLSGQNLDLGLLAPVLPAFMREPEGSTSYELTARGGAQGPMFDGFVQVDQAGVGIPLLGARLSPIDARIVASGQRLDIERFSISGERGRVEVRGGAELAGLESPRWTLEASFQQFAVARAPQARFELNGQLGLEGPIDAAEFDGRLVLDDAGFRAPGQDDPIWNEIRVLSPETAPTSIREGRAAPSLTDRWSGRFELVVPPQTWIRSREVELELVGAIELRKQAKEPVRLFGALEVNRGTVLFGQRRLEVERGRARFTGAPGLDPEIDVLAATRIDDYRVMVELRGPLSEPSIQIRSDPPLVEDDVLALLLFGRRSAELGQSGAVAINALVSQLGSGLGFDGLRNQLRGILPFDTFAVSVDAHGDARIEVGRYIGNGVFVTYGRTVDIDQNEGDANDPADEVGVEWRLSRSVRVQSSTSTNGHVGADVIWEKDY